MKIGQKSSFLDKKNGNDESVCFGDKFRGMIPPLNCLQHQIFLNYSMVNNTVIVTNLFNSKNPCITRGNTTSLRLVRTDFTVSEATYSLSSGGNQVENL